jgi:formate hydrogenlyase subunit 3/multisubunit Na+/H+ antiporter MnhD subunit
MTVAGLLLASTLALPLLMVVACLKPFVRARALDLLPFAPLPGLIAALLAPGGALVLAPDPMRMVLTLDTAGAVLLGGAALLWTFAGLYARSYMKADPKAARFAVWWLLTLAGSLGVFIVADIASFYLMFALVSLSAFGLVSHEGTPGAARASFIYMLLAIVGEALLLLAFVMLAVGAQGNPLIGEALASLPGSPWEGAIIILLVLGFGLKMGLVPLHVWMPLAHPVAPMPASAALSGIVVKAGVIGLIRFLPLDVGLPDWGTALSVLGLATAYYAVLVGITQQHPKTVLAYSTVSQMGVVATLIGAGMAAGSPLTGDFAAYYALHHMLVKGALFLGVGVTAAGGRRLPWIMGTMTVLALSLAGLPLTSGALAKYATKGIIHSDLIAALMTLSAAGSALLMLHFLWLLAEFGEREPQARKPTVRPALGLVLPFAGIAAAALIVPWLLLEIVTGYRPGAMLGLDALWKGSWPLIVGGLLFQQLRRASGRLPRIPEGDVVVLAEAAAPWVVRFSVALEREDGVLRRWPVAGIALLAIVLALGAALRLAS